MFHLRLDLEHDIWQLIMRYSRSKLTKEKLEILSHKPKD
jgi:hypothetical protein